ncbi:MAG: anthranilate phosphoribosyltransferase [Bacillota bacterium]|nr:anthranilate phosphoribosyltransferase [Desulfurispora thermophila]
MQQLIGQIIEGHHLHMEQAEQLMTGIMSGQLSPAQIGALLVALRWKGETVEEIVGFARAMRQKAIPIPHDHEVLVDTCGTGGDGAGTMNISTAAALVVAGAGIPVAKHGNRSVSSKCGSADVLEHLGVNLYLPAEQLAACLREVGIVFLFAPHLHPAMAHVSQPRREIGVRTVFNILGPLCNPAGANCQVIGVFSEALLEKMARAVQLLGTRRAFLVHGREKPHGLDEVSISSPTVVYEVTSEHIGSFILQPHELGLATPSMDELRCRSVEQAAAMLLAVLQGRPGAARNAVLLNAALGIMAAGAAEDYRTALQLAAHSIDSGRALDKLSRLIHFCRRVESEGTGSGVKQCCR